MENAVDALKMAAAVFVFVIAMTLTINVFIQIRQTSDSVIRTSDKANYYEYVGDETTENNNIRTKRVVGVETIIPTLYRYTNESIAVIIKDSDDSIIQVFDLTFEHYLLINENASDIEDSEIYQFYYTGNKVTTQKLIRDIKESYQECMTAGSNNIETAPWNIDQKTHKKRIDLFISGTTGLTNDEKTINGVKIKYDQGFFDTYKGKRFEESFKEIEITEKDNTDYDAELLGGASSVSKIKIEYKLID